LVSDLDVTTRHRREVVEPKHRLAEREGALHQGRPIKLLSDSLLYDVFHPFVDEFESGLGSVCEVP